MIALTRRRGQIRNSWLMRVVVGDATLHGTALVSEVGAARESYTAVVDHDVTMPKIVQHCDVQRFGCGTGHFARSDNNR